MHPGDRRVGGGLFVVAGVSAYADFVRQKSQIGGEHGFEPSFIHPKLYDFQSHLVDFACRQGRGAIFADCGLGKTPIQLTWAHNVTRRENKPVLIIAPLMVSLQTVEEAAKFDLPAVRILDGKLPPSAEIVTTNYERLANFDPNDFAGVVCDESSIMKNFDGARRSEITEFMKRVRYRLLCSATPSPNDYIELGTSSEALGYLGYMDMLAMFFKNDEDSLHPMSMGSQWRFKTHAQRDFWRWVCSWARATRKPSDLGYDDGPFKLPELIEREHVVDSVVRCGDLFALPSTNLREEREERRSTILQRCERAAQCLEGADSAVAWADLNAEADTLLEMMPGAMQVKGGDPDEKKEEIFTAFRRGELKRLVTKPKIAAYGLNFQFCNRTTIFANHSYESYYQAVRRFWRFGQTRSVTVDMITTESLSGVTKNLKRKGEQADAMFSMMVAQMNESLGLKRLTEHKVMQHQPVWLS